MSFDGQSCQHRLLVKRVNKERDGEREEMTYSNCAERQILICLFSDCFQLPFTGQIGDRSGGSTVAVTKYFYRKKNQLVQSECFIVLNLTFSAFVVSFVMSQFICIFFCQEEGVIKNMQKSKKRN